MLDLDELKSAIGLLRGHVCEVGKILVRQLKRRDALRRQTEAHSDVITKQLRKCEYIINTSLIQVDNVCCTCEKYEYFEKNTSIENTKLNGNEIGFIFRFKLTQMFLALKII